ncbi:hypothetical protein P280DRAFT_249272 [Massarina eburnea CBS 473.64]|uniref:Uncharacterized protein n=1 Tax=Massarina eburnea CBS 473.64 TaxID=1395130 RepID=A0A6A6S6P1_9PLEO|nr:hypothetical protein P280DRAFT_249272 [Massarina eburnea CBS 473.64]
MHNQLPKPSRNTPDVTKSQHLQALKSPARTPPTGDRCAYCTACVRCCIHLASLASVAIPPLHHAAKSWELRISPLRQMICLCQCKRSPSRRMFRRCAVYREIARDLFLHVSGPSTSISDTMESVTRLLPFSYTTHHLRKPFIVNINDETGRPTISVSVRRYSKDRT